MKGRSAFGDAIGPCLYTAGQIADAVEGLAGRIAADYAGQPLLLLGVLKGALYFTVDLARALAGVADGPSEIVVDYLSTGSYGSLDHSSGVVRLVSDATEPIEGRNVLIVEDIADNGLTLAFLHTLLEKRRPASLRTCVLLDKPSGRRTEVALDYVGLSVPDAFVVGYGLDYQELYRNLPYLAQLNPPNPTEKSQESQRF